MAIDALCVGQALNDDLVSVVYSLNREQHF